MKTPQLTSYSMAKTLKNFSATKDAHFWDLFNKIVIGRAIKQEKEMKLLERKK